MTPYFGDFAEDATVRIPFNTFDSNDPSASATITNLADADIKVHKDGSLTQIATDGATVVIDFDSITGNHMITIDTSASADYSTGSDYQVRIEGTTVDAGTINAFVGSFSIENRYNAAAEDLANVTDGLGAIKTVIDAILVDTGTTIPGTIATVDSNVDAILVDTGTTIPGTIATVDSNVDAILVDTGTTIPATLTNMSGATFNTSTDSLEAIRNRGDAAWVTGGGGSLTVADIADGVWDEVLSGHLTAGTTGAALNAAGSAGDPWITALPGSYTAGQAGKIIGDNINATISSRMAEASINTTAGAIDNVTLVATTTTNTDMRGTDSAATASALATVDSNVDAILVDTGTTIPGTIATVDSNVDAILVDTVDIQSRIPSSLTGGRLNVNVEAMNNDTDAVDRLQSGVKGNVTGTASTSSTVTSITTSALSPSGVAADQFKGKTITFKNDTTTTSLRGQSTDITANTASATPTFTVTALTTAPASGDTFTIT